MCIRDRGKAEENAEFDSGEESCACKIQALSRRPLPCPSKEKTNDNSKPEATDDSIVLTEDEQKSPIEMQKKKFAHNVPPSSNAESMNQYLMRTKALTEEKADSRFSFCYKKTLIEGHLLKKSRGAWKPKYCVVRHKTFVYFSSKGNCRVKGCLQFNNINSRLRHVVNSSEFEYFLLTSLES
eukprot:TRINITY_DN8245_c0_g1_i8.p2 TRINITY_DN8245_c0_g1~~TRINITY_DN8245_c0_g1_i8.p2  ORF type:complete len:182 (+),score=56.79 TRINITY_DN8245_c0_g1_i8:73-618(+)